MINGVQFERVYVLTSEGYRITTTVLVEMPEHLDPMAPENRGPAWMWAVLELERMARDAPPQPERVPQPVVIRTLGQAE